MVVTSTEDEEDEEEDELLMAVHSPLPEAPVYGYWYDGVPLLRVRDPPDRRL